MKSILEIKVEDVNSVILDFKDGSISTNNNVTPNKRITVKKMYVHYYYQVFLILIHYI